jgi:hypothetical protein
MQTVREGIFLKLPGGENGFFTQELRRGINAAH